MPQINLVGGNNITLSQSANSVVISAGDATVSMWPSDPQPMSGVLTLYSGSAGAGASTSATTVSANVFPMAIEANVNYNQVRLLASNSIISGATSASGTYRQGVTFGLYTWRTQDDSMGLVSSYTASMQYSHGSTNTSANQTYGFSVGYGGGTAGSVSFSGSSGNTSQFSAIARRVSGWQQWVLGDTNTVSLSAGQYYGVVAWSFQTGGTNHGTMNSIGLNSGVNGWIASQLGEDNLTVTSPLGQQGVVSLVMTAATSNTPGGLTALLGTAGITRTTGSASVSNISMVPWVQFARTR